MKTPDTLDLASHARLALNHLTRNVDEKRSYLPYFRTVLLSDPPEARHENWDYGDLSGRYVDAIILARQMTGDDRNADVEAGMRELLLATFSEEDGLTYRQKTPWSDYEADIFDQSSTLLALVSWFLLEGDESIRERIEGMINGLWDLAVKKDGFCYFEYPTYRPGRKESYHRNNWPMPDPCHHGGRIILPLSRYYEETRSKNARRLIEGLSEYVINGSGVFGADGSFEGHFHSRAATITGILRFAMAEGRGTTVEWCRKVYDWARLQGLALGWFPEFLMRDPSDQSITCESCIITDMLHCAIRLAKYGYPQYWDDVDRFVRNHLIESQLRDVAWVKQSKEKQDTDKSSFRDVAERVRGGFAGWSKPNDFIGEIRYPAHIAKWLEPDWRTTRHMMNCCSPAGARALFLVWDNMISRKGSDTTVDLLLNRETEWLRVASSLPHRGEVEMLAKVTGDLHIRMPPWEAVRAEIDGKRAEPRWNTSHYLSLESLDAGTRVRVAYPLRHRRESAAAGGEEYELSWRGNTVTRVEPKGTYYPLYDRRSLEADAVPFTEEGKAGAVESRVHW